MKKMVFLFFMMGAAALCFAQTATLDVAISGSRTYIESRLTVGTRVLIADLAAPTRELGVYAAEELSTRLVNSRRLTVVERSADVMRSLDMEAGYQLSGEVSDETIQGIGHRTGAEAIVTGRISRTGDRYRLHLRITSVRTAELLGQYSVFFQPDTVLNSLLANNQPPRGKPLWISEPLSARLTFEAGGSITGVSQWYYDVGISNRTTSLRTARNRARQDVQRSVAENIASDIRSRINVTTASEFLDSGIEDVETRIETVLTNSIRTRVPRFEVLEWHDTTGTLDGRNYHMSFVLVRFPRHEIITMVERIEPDSIVDSIIRELNASISAAERAELIRELEAGRDFALETVSEGFGGR